MAEAANAAVVTAGLLVIGDEILSGRTKDKNIGFIAEHLTLVGIQLREVRVVPDIESRIVEALNALRAAYDYVFTTGGIGPTHDDITADAIAKAFGVGIDIDPRAVAIMKPHYDALGLELTPARLRMARLPFGSELVENAISKAPGFMVGNVIVMAGVPSIMQTMLISVTPRLRTGRPVQSLTLKIRRPESDVAEPLRLAQQDFSDVPMGSYPFTENGRWGTNLVLRSADETRLKLADSALRERLAALGISPEATG
ncbi:MAG: molybdopterin-binding protein [Hyphomicrobiaceae bacterium]